MVYYINVLKVSQEMQNVKFTYRRYNDNDNKKGRIAWDPIVTNETISVNSSTYNRLIKGGCEVKLSDKTLTKQKFNTLEEQLNHSQQKIDELVREKQQIKGLNQNLQNQLTEANNTIASLRLELESKTKDASVSDKDSSDEEIKDASVSDDDSSDEETKDAPVSGKKNKK